MSLRRILLSNFAKEYCFRRRVHNYATVYETNDSKNSGKKAKVQGWVRAFRSMKEKIFFDLNDGSSSQPLQVVVDKSIKPEGLNYGCSVTAEGEITVAPNGRAELQAEKINVIGKCDIEGYPFLPRKKYSEDYIRQYLHLRPRTRNFSSIMRLRDIATNAIRDHFRDRGFINVHTPIITSNDCEGAGEVFTIQPESKELLEAMKTEGVDAGDSYFNSKAFLTVSGQLHLEACARALSKVYNFSPAFRAENTKSRLHLSEFYMIEAEMAFVTSLKELTTEVELLIKSITLNLLEKGSSDIEILEIPKATWLNKDFSYLTYTEALKILSNNSDKLTVPIRPGENLAKEHELFLVRHLGHVPLFLTEWPKDSKPFYMKECEDDKSKVQAMDLLVPIVGELIGGSLREDDYFKLESKMPSEVNLNWYLEIRKFGNIPTGGFGMGFERYLQFILGVPNIKDVIPFPRWPHNCKF